MWGRALLAGLFAVVIGLGQAAAQPVPDLGLGQLRSPVLTIDADRLFGETQFGARVRAEVSAAADALAAENRGIEAMLKEEVDSLTERRPTMEVGIFRTEAEAFDTRVQTIRQRQDAKEQSLNQALTLGREAFLEAATPVLGQLMIESGAVVILDRRSIFLGVGLVDVTQDAIYAIDAALGEGDWELTALPIAPPEIAPPEIAPSSLPDAGADP